MIDDVVEDNENKMADPKWFKHTIMKQLDNNSSSTEINEITL